MKMSLRRLAIVAVVLSAVVLVSPASPAAAHPASFGWSDNHQICKFSTGCVRTGNIVRLWQAILWADNRFESTSNIDGEFGPNTHNWTVQWQSRHMNGDLSGKVGPNTWGAAYSLLSQEGCTGSGWDEFSYAEYNGPSRVLHLAMLCTTGEWRFVNPRDGKWWHTSH